MLHIKDNSGVIAAKGTTDENRGNMDVYVFLVDGVLIDTGPQTLLEDFIPFFKKGDFDQVVITHHHEDHTGGAKWIQDHFKVPIYIHEDAVDLCVTAADYPLYRQIVWGQREGFTAKPLEKKFKSRASQWEAIYTPDHAFDHMVLLNHSTGTLFSGDLFVTPRPKVMLSFESVPVIMESIRKVLAYDFEEMYCSHAGYVRNGKDMLKRKHDYMEKMSVEILELYDKGWSVEEIQSKLMPPKYPIIGLSDGEWDTLHFITSVLKHHRP